MRSLIRLSPWLSLLLLCLIGCGPDGPTPALPLTPGEMRTVIEVPPLNPFDSKLANSHHRWMREHWADIERDAGRDHVGESVPRALDRIAGWCPLSPELRALVESVLNGHRPPGYESVFQAAEALQGWIARGVTPEVARQRLSRMTVAREWPEHWEILLSTWQVSLEQGSSLTGALTSDAYTVDFIGTVVAGPEGGAAASAGYLIGRLIRELL